MPDADIAALFQRTHWATCTLMPSCSICRHHRRHAVLWLLNSHIVSVFFGSRLIISIQFFLNRRLAKDAQELLYCWPLFFVVCYLPGFVDLPCCLFLIRVVA